MLPLCNPRKCWMKKKQGLEGGYWRNESSKKRNNQSYKESGFSEDEEGDEKNKTTSSNNKRVTTDLCSVDIHGCYWTNKQNPQHVIEPKGGLQGSRNRLQASIYLGWIDRKPITIQVDAKMCSSWRSKRTWNSSRPELAHYTQHRNQHWW